MSQEGVYFTETVIETIEGNSGGPVTPDASGNFFILGENSQGIDTSGDPVTHTLTVTAFDATETQKGVVELATDAEAIAGSASTNLAIIPSSLTAKLGTQTANGIAYGAGTSSALQWTSAGTDGQLIIGATGGAPAFADLTSTGGTIAITAGANTLNIDVDVEVATQFDTDSGSAIPSGNILDILGGTNINTAGATNVVTVNLDTDVAGLTSLEVDNLRLDGNTISSTDTNGDITLTPDGTGVVNISYGTQYAIPYFETGGEITEVGPLTDGQLIIGATGAAPAAATLTAGTNISITNAANSITIDAHSGSQVVNVTSLDNTDSPYTVLSDDYYMSCDVSSGTLTIDLPDSPDTGRVFVVKDSGGDANTNNITVTTVGGAVNIDGATTFVMNTDYQATQFLFNGTSYEVF
jgi:hypothetical protein